MCLVPSLRAEGDEGLDEDGGLGVDVRAHHDLGAGQGLVRLQRKDSLVELCFDASPFDQTSIKSASGKNMLTPILKLRFAASLYSDPCN